MPPKRPDLLLESPELLLVQPTGVLVAHGLWKVLNVSSYYTEDLKADQSAAGFARQTEWVGTIFFIVWVSWFDSPLGRTWTGGRCCMHSHSILWISKTVRPRELCAGRTRDKKFFVRGSECWLNACESEISKIINPAESLWRKGVEKLCLTGPKLCHYLGEDHTMNGSLSS